MTAPVWRTTGEAEHATLGRTARPPSSEVVMATHFTGGAVVVTVQADGAVQVLGSRGEGGSDPAELSELAELAELSELAELAERHTGRRSGRLFHFPGVADLVGRMTLAQLVARSAIDAVVMLGQPEPLGPDTVIDTQDFVRPHFVEGRVVLDVRPAADGLVIPFEQPHPTPCCADH